MRPTIEPIERRILLAAAPNFFIQDGDLWKTDASGSTVVVDTPGIGELDGTILGSEVTDVLNIVGGVAYYFIDNETFGGTKFVLWRTDGTQAGTTQIATPDGVFGIDDMASVNGMIFFMAEGGVGLTHQLWKSDGTEAGTTLIKDGWTYSLVGPEPVELSFTAVGDTLYFTPQDNAHGLELWKSDGSAQGTVLVKDIVAGPSGSGPDELRPFGEALLFTAYDGAQRQLWRSDGTAAGTVPAEVVDVVGSPGPDYIVATVNGANLELRRNGELVRTIPLINVAQLSILCDAGDDVVDCSTVPVPVFAYGGDGADKLVGGSGPDTLVGGAQKDTLTGGIGNDRLNGNGGHDRLFGGPNADRLFGYDGNDWLEGGSSNDRLEGGNGVDSMYGVGGDDRFFSAGDNSIDELFGGKNNDSARVDATDLVIDVETIA